MLISCAQKKISAYNPKAYYTVSSPGAQIAPEAGQPAQFIVQRFMYLQVPAGVKKISITKAQADKKVFNTSFELITQTEIVVGKRFTDGETLEKVSAKKGFKLLKIFLIPVTNSVSDTEPLKTIVISGTLDGKPFSVQVTNEQQLQGIPYQ